MSLFTITEQAELVNAWAWLASVAPGTEKLARLDFVDALTLGEIIVRRGFVLVGQGWG
jgi:hypothetical protein